MKMNVICLMQLGKYPVATKSCYTDIMAPLAAMLSFLKMEVVSQLVPGFVYRLLPVSRFLRLSAC